MKWLFNTEKGLEQSSGGREFHKERAKNKGDNERIFFLARGRRTAGGRLRSIERKGTDCRQCSNASLRWAGTEFDRKRDANLASRKCRWATRGVSPARESRSCEILSTSLTPEIRRAARRWTRSNSCAFDLPMPLQAKLPYSTTGKTCRHCASEEQRQFSKKVDRFLH